ncbi:GNAT family N-acetyltransferase [Bifidobacterium sp. 82T24]|uniref:GNAT family N-acetyltransferase n=1 Tax=Bifidobacterium pluvialisilvae TaxID=2834436 RepID=UPI001C59CBEE|nr:N-acetyltransferase [Bifidobacterium pluvialisilvae]MBW3087702.1 GNAT family N-acetyltransferase [Bifidobacterium pluvialisilvae]
MCVRHTTIRHATLDDLDAIAAVESACFPPAEAASREDFRRRLEAYPNHFWLMVDNENDSAADGADNHGGGTLISFVNGMTTDERDLADVMYADAAMHDEHGRWQMVFGVNTMPEYRRHGYASAVLRRVIDDAREQGRAGVVLTCKTEKIAFYARLGFVDEGVSDSTHGGVVWHQMRVTF